MAQVTADQLERAADPYELTPEGIKDPPRGWIQSIRYLGPGLILSASIVGSGELIATTTLGAQVGFALLWLVIFSCAVKVALQVEIARWTITTGSPALSGYNRVPPVFGRIGWINLLWILLMLSKILQVGGIVGGTAVALSIMLPFGGDGLSDTSITIWHGIVVVASIALLFTNSYRLIERGAFVLVVVFSLVTVLIAFGLPFTPFGFSSGELFSGLSLAIPAGAIGAALAMFGITGVGADEITTYNYWCIEKGYARWTGPNDGSKAWVERARGWIGVMYKDATLSMVIYTLSTVAFYLMGAAILNRQGLVPGGANEMITTLARMYTDTLGPWAYWLFLIGAVAVLGSTLWAAIPSTSRMYANFLATVGVFDWKDAAARLGWIRVFTVVLPILWAATSLFIQAPVVMVQIGGVMTGVFLLAVVVAAWYLRRAETDRRAYGGSLFTGALVLSSLAIGALALYTVVSTLGLFKVA